MKKSWLLIITCFFTGYTIIALELLGFRILAPYFGYSTYVWGSLLGLIMIALSIGYYLGGRWADRNPSLNILYSWLLISSLYILAMIFLYKPLLSSFTSLGVIAGSLTATFALFGIPMVLLSAVSPFVIKFLARIHKVGTTAGTIYSIATIGSIAGTFLTSFIFIPFYGTLNTFIITFVILLLVTMANLLTKSKHYLVLMLLFAFLFFAPSYRHPEIIYETESAYSLIRVAQFRSTRYLFLNKMEGIQSVYDKHIITWKYYDYLLMAPLLNNAETALILGLGGGTSVRQLNKYFPELDIDAVEIDPKVVEVAEEYFGLDTNSINIHIEDARTFVANCPKKYDTVLIDLYHGGSYMPFYVATQEFFQDIKDCMTEKGILIMNVIAVDGKQSLADPVAATMGNVFPYAYKFKASEHNMVVMATMQLSKQDIYDRLNSITDAELSRILGNVYLEDYNNGAIFTDDKAPVESITYNMLKELA